MFVNGITLESNILSSTSKMTDNGSEEIGFFSASSMIPPPDPENLGASDGFVSEVTRSYETSAYITSIQVKY